MHGFEDLLGLATGLTKMMLSLEPRAPGGVHFRTRDLPWGWSGAVTTSSPWLDLRGPYGSQLFVTAETATIMRMSKQQQEQLLGFPIPSIVLSGRTGYGGSGSSGHLYIKWTALQSKRPNTYLVFLYQTRLPRDEAEAEFEEMRHCIEFVELLER